MQEINFSFNWNKKLDCKAFTTIRLSGKYNIGEKIEVRLKKALHCYGEIIDKKNFNIEKITDWIAYLDTGYDRTECIKILQTMYKNKNINWKMQPVFYYLIKRSE